MQPKATPDPDRPKLTIWELAKEIMPAWEPLDWFKWPPDIFALTSNILTTTGIYRYAVTPYDKAAVPGSRLNLQRERELRTQSEKWRAWLLRGALDEGLPAELARLCAALTGGADCPAYLGDEVEPVASETCREILWLHALADTACEAFGILCAPANHKSPIIFWANLLLEQTGSLTRLPKRHGLVLPKMRTPQSGLTPRSFSHHLTYHQSEVSVNWRTVPWFNQDENTINILTVPVPYHVDAKDFRPYEQVKGKDFPGQSEDVGRVRYFVFDPKESCLDTEQLITLLLTAQREVSRVHILVFPEVALKKAEIDKLKSALERNIRPHKIPMIITGVRGEHDNELGLNQVMLSFYMADKWYDLVQDKHHRWKLDTTQIQQYALAPTLNSSYQWWEGIHLPHRQLTFLCPNGWLTLCPLICEDLAQLEPVSALIRGVGPTLVIALLLDGPQITDRWSARYVGVLADDPGSSILTVTSLGMAVRSRQRGKPVNRTVVLWKDQERGWEPIELKEGEGATLLTINAKLKEEFTADGRSDNAAASTLVIQSIRNIPLPPPAKPNPPAEQVRGDRSGPNVAAAQEMSAESIPSSVSKDVEEVTILEYLVDALIDSSSDFMEQLSRLSRGQLGKLEGERRFAKLAGLLERLRQTLISHEFGPPVATDKAEAEGEPATAPRNLLDDYLVRDAFESLYQLIMSVNTDQQLAAVLMSGEEEEIEQKLGRWLQLVSIAEQRLQNTYETDCRQDPLLGRAIKEKALTIDNYSEYVRLRYLIYLSTLWAVHNRLMTQLGRRRQFKVDDVKRCREGVRRIERLIEEYRGASKRATPLPVG